MHNQKPAAGSALAAGFDYRGYDCRHLVTRHFVNPMIHPTAKHRRQYILPLILGALCMGGCAHPTAKPASTQPASTQPAKAAVDSTADRTWNTLKQEVDTPPEQLKQLPDRMYTDEEVTAYYTKLANHAGDLADQARRFYAQYPDHPRASDARELYFDMLHAAVSLRTNSRIAELEAVTAQRLNDPKLDEAGRFQLALRLLHSAVAGRQAENDNAMRAELETRARQLAKDYPNHPDGVNFLLNLARVASTEKAAALARDILAAGYDVKTRIEAQGLLNRADALGKPLDLKLPIAGGKVLDLNQMRGKVVLLLLWDTKSKFAEKALWAVNEMYKAHHSEGMEACGLNFDENPDAANEMLKNHQIEWPQYFDLPAGGKIQRQFGLYSLPMVWAVDKKGVLRDLRFERNPEVTLKKLMAE